MNTQIQNTSQMDKKNYPLVLSKEIEKLLRTFRNLALKNSNIISKSENDSEDLIYFSDIDKPEFFFKIFEPSQTALFAPVFNFEYMPQNESNFLNTRIRDKHESIVKHFENWIGYLKAYNKIDFTEDQKLTSFYENEYYVEFEIIEENADIEPFNDEQQALLFSFFTQLTSELKKINSENPKLLEIISDTEDLKNNIQNYSKKMFIVKMSKVFAKLKKFSLQLALEILDIAKKEVIKKVLSGGFENAGNLLNGIF
jgi:hypothetical protein